MTSKLRLALAIALFALLGTTAGLAQDNARIIFDNRSAGGSATQDVTPTFPFPTTGGGGGGATLPLTKECTATITVTTGVAYTNNASIGGLLSFTNCVNNSGDGGTINGAILTGSDGNIVTYDLALFRTVPTGTVTNNVVYAEAATDLPLQFTTIQFFNNTVQFGTPIVFANTAIGAPFRLTTGTTIFGVLVVRGTPTFTVTNSVSVRLIIYPDR